MRILLINPPHWLHTGIHNNQNIGLGLLTLASYLEKMNFAVEVLDAEALKWDYDRLGKHIQNFKPDLVGVTATTLSFNAMVKTCKLSRSLGVERILIGGSHVSAMPHKSLALTGADACIVGEGESVIQFALDHDGVILSIPTESIDLPLNYKLVNPSLPSNVYVGNDPVYKLPEAVVMWERGCPHKCNFCSTNVVHGRNLRFKSVEAIIEELKTLKGMGFKSIFVYDDELVGVTQKQHDWLIEICESIKTNKLDNLVYKCQGRCNPHLLTTELLKSMREAGFKTFMMGCESGSQKVLDAINKNITVDDIWQSLRAIHDMDLATFTYWMVGNKEETSADCQKTYELIKEIKKWIHFKHVTILNPLVGTDIYKEAMANGWIIDYNFNNWGQHGKVVMENPEWMSEREILGWEKRLLEA